MPIPRAAACCAAATILLGKLEWTGATGRIRSHPLLRTHNPVFLELYGGIQSYLRAEPSPEATVGGAGNAGESAETALQAVASALPEAAEAAKAVKGVVKKSEDTGVSAGAEFGTGAEANADDVDVDNMPTPAEFTEQAIKKNEIDVAAQERKDKAVADRIAQEEAWKSTTTLPPTTTAPPATTAPPLDAVTHPPSTTSAPEPIEGHVVSIVSRNSRKLGPDQCVKNSATRRPRPSGDTYEKLNGKWLDIAVMCCSDNFANDKVTPKRKIKKKCHKALTFHDANDLCEGIHYRLCTSSEVRSGIGDDSGCNFNKMHVWTSDACNASKKKSAKSIERSPRKTTTAKPQPRKSFEALFEGGIRPSDTDKADMEGIVILEKRSSGAESSKATAVAAEHASNDESGPSEFPPDAGAQNILFLQTAETSPGKVVSANEPSSAATLRAGALIPPSGKASIALPNVHAEQEGVVNLEVPAPSEHAEGKNDVDEDVSIFQPQTFFGERTTHSSGLPK